MKIVFNDLHLRNVYSLINVTVSDILTDFSDLQSEKAHGSILIIPSGMVIEVKYSHPEKA